MFGLCFFLFTLFLMLCCLGVRILFPGKWARLCAKVEYSVKMIDVYRHLPEAIKKTKSPLLATCNYETSYAESEFWIAHGGGVGEYVHTNCLEAVQDSMKRGFRFIELDLLETTDGCMVGGHSWRELRLLVGADAEKEKPLSKSDIELLRPKWKGTPLFSEDICRLLRENPHLVLVTDKTQNFELLMREIPHPDQMVLEAFDFPAYLNALRAGFSNVALSSGMESHLQQAIQFKIPGIVMDASLLESRPEVLLLVKQLHQSGCCISVFYSNACDKQEYIHRHLGKNISRIYTDTWSPATPPPSP